MTSKMLLGAASALALVAGTALAQDKSPPGGADTAAPTHAAPQTPATDTPKMAPSKMGADSTQPSDTGADTSSRPPNPAAAETATPSDVTPATTPTRSVDTTTPTRSTDTATAPHPMGEPVIASHLMGQDVIGPDGKKIGDINDLVVDTASGQIEQVVIKHGGVLGVGGKSVAVNFSQIQLLPNQGVHASLTEDQLKSMPDFDKNATVSLTERTSAAAGGPVERAPAPGATTVPATPRQ